MTAQPMFTEIDGYPLAGSRWPDDAASIRSATGPPIVLLHAGVGDRRSWDRTAEQLTDLGPLVAYDRRGFGDSPVSPGPYRDLDDLWAVVDGVSTGPVWLVGSSMGGLLALDAALTDPDRVAGLVLLAPAVSGAPEDDDDLDPQTRSLSDQLGAAAEAGDATLRLQLRLRLWLDGPAAAAPRVDGPARELALAMNEIILRNDVDDEASAAGVDAWSRLAEISAPATVAWGDLDVPVLITQCEQLAHRLPRAQSRILPGTAHLPYLERPDLVADVIREAVRAR
jgi:pimeloyl-ACP methyl ester carboxylesterase